jgi:hypothetical protein
VLAERATIRVAWGACREEPAPFEPWEPILRGLGWPMSGLTAAAGTVPAVRRRGGRGDRTDG